MSTSTNSKIYVNKLAVIGGYVSYNDHVLNLLEGLGRDYNPFVTLVTNKLDKHSIEEIHSLLFSYEFHIDTQNSFEQLSSL